MADCVCVAHRHIKCHKLTIPTTLPMSYSTFALCMAIFVLGRLTDRLFYTLLLHRLVNGFCILGHIFYYKVPNPPKFPNGIGAQLGTGPLRNCAAPGDRIKSCRSTYCKDKLFGRGVLVFEFHHHMFGYKVSNGSNLSSRSRVFELDAVWVAGSYSRTLSLSNLLEEAFLAFFERSLQALLLGAL